MSTIKICAAIVVGLLLMPADELRPEGVALNGERPTFCQRNPHTCLAGTELKNELQRKLRYVVSLGGDIVRDQWNRQQPGGLQAAAYPGAAPYPSVQPGTLSSSDLEPQWRGAGQAPGR